MRLNESGYLARAYRAGRIGLHVAYGVAVAGTVFSWLPEATRTRVLRRWSVRLLRILNVRIRVRGEAPGLSAGNGMVVANHVSWLDIYLLKSVCPARFVAKSEVRAWPVIGWLSHRVGTLFIERAKRHDAARINQEVVTVLREGGRVAVFPEGTTSDGSLLRPFHAPLLQPLVHSEGTLWPVGLRFLLPDGSLDTAPAYVDDVSFGESFARVLARREILAELVFAPPIAAAGKTRRELAREAEQAIASALSLAVPGKRSETAAHLPAAGRTDPPPTDNRCPERPDSPVFSSPALTSARK